MNFVFLMDPLESIKIKTDTTYALMVESHQRGHQIHYCSNRGIFLKEGKVFFHVHRIIAREDTKQPFETIEKLTLSQDDVDVVFIRTDPPFSEEYLLNTWLLDRLPGNIAVINAPTGIRTVNEKIWSTQFTQIVPKTTVTCHKSDILKFLDQEKEMIVKPTDGFGGMSVFYVKKGDKNTNVILETITSQWRKCVIVQKYLPQARHGDKRILLLDSEPLGAVLRIHTSEDHRNNFYAGAQPAPADITAQDEKIISVLKPHLRRLGLYFVGIDVIGGLLVEVNVTSPTCLREMNRLYRLRLESRVIDFSEGLAERLKKSS